MQKQRPAAKTQATKGQQIERHNNRTARAVLLASEAVPDDLRPCWEVAVKASTLQGGEAAFFGGTRKKLEAQLIKAGLPITGIGELERIGLILFFSTLGRQSSNYLFVSLCFPESFPDAYTADQRRIALRLIDKHASELTDEEHTAAVYAVACSFAVIGGQLRFSLGLLRFFLENYYEDFSKIEAVLESWRRDMVIKSLTDAAHYLMFDYNYLVGDWGQA